MELGIAALQENGRLIVHYLTENDLPSPVYVHQYVDTYPAPVRSSYVYVEPGGTLALYFASVRAPSYVALAHEGRPWAERLQPGEALKASIALDIPVLERGKLQGADAAAPHVVQLVSELRVVMTYQPERRGLDVQRWPGLDLYDVYGHPPLVLEASLALATPVPALRRTDPFDRPMEPLPAPFASQ